MDHIGSPNRIISNFLRTQRPCPFFIPQRPPKTCPSHSPPRAHSGRGTHYSFFSRGRGASKLIHSRTIISHFFITKRSSLVVWDPPYSIRQGMMGFARGGGHVKEDMTRAKDKKKKIGLCGGAATPTKTTQRHAHDF